MRTPARRQKYSEMKWLIPPPPEVPYSSRPASPARAARGRRGSRGQVRVDQDEKGARASSATASKLPTASQGVRCDTAEVAKEDEVTMSVWPSAGACATCAAPMAPPAPGRFSTTKGWPVRACNRSASGRATTSFEPPGGKGTTSRTARCGQPSPARGPDWRRQRRSAGREERAPPDTPFCRTGAPMLVSRPALLRFRARVAVAPWSHDAPRGQGPKGVPQGDRATTRARVAGRFGRRRLHPWARRSGAAVRRRALAPCTALRRDAGSGARRGRGWHGAGGDGRAGAVHGGARQRGMERRPAAMPSRRR